MSSSNPHRSRPHAHSIQSFSSSVIEKTPSTKGAKANTLARRLLFPHLPPDADLPPIFASQLASPDLNAEVYDFVAIALRAYVIPWWTKITRYDKEFLPQITRVLTAVARALESRLTATDLSPLVFRDIPTLLTQHTVDYRNARSKLNSSYAAAGAATLPHLFHQMQPHMAVSPDGKIEEAYIRQAADHVLKALLPLEDYGPEAERYIIREIVVNVLMAVLPRLAQPWFIHKLILDYMGPEKEGDRELAEPSDHLQESTSSASQSSRPPLPRQRSYNFSFQSIVIFVLSAVRSLSGGCLALIHAYKQTLGTIKKVNQSGTLFPPPGSHSAAVADTSFNGDHGQDDTASLKSTLPGTLVPMTPMTPGMVPPPSISSSSSQSSSSISDSSYRHSQPQPPQPPPPNYTHSVLHLFSTLVTPPPPTVIPISVSSPSVNQYANLTPLALTHILSLIVTMLSPFFSRLLPYLLYTNILSPSSLANIVRIARRALFPNGWPAPPPVDPTPEEQIEMRQELERRLLALVPGPLAPLLGPTPQSRSYTITCILDPISSQACNAHLVIFILDLILVTIFPEMGVSESAMGVLVEEQSLGMGVATTTAAAASTVMNNTTTKTTANSALNTSPPRPEVISHPL